MEKMYKILKDFSIFILVQYIFLTADARCPNNLPDTTTTNDYNGFCYQFVDKEKYWTDAQDYCLKYGGSVVMLRDSRTNDFITGVLSSLSWRNNGVWIGLNDKGDELKWKWATARAGSHLDMQDGDWTNWARGHPEARFHSLRDCVRMVRKDNWKWHETPCSIFNWKYKFICQYELPPTPARINPLPERQYLTQPVRTSSTRKPSTIKASLTSVKPDAVTLLDNDLITRQTGDLLVEVVDIPAEQQSVVSAADNRSKRRVHIWAISSACVGAVLFIAIVLIMMLLKRRKPERDIDSNFCANPMYDKSDTKTEVRSNGRVDNVYVEPDQSPLTGKTYLINAEGIPEKPQENGYLVPRSLIDIPQAYLTTAEVEAKVRDVENIKVAVVSGNESDRRQTEVSQKDGDYEVTMDEPIYSEIPEKNPHM